MNSEQQTLVLRLRWPFGRCPIVHGRNDGVSRKKYSSHRGKYSGSEGVSEIYPSINMGKQTNRLKLKTGHWVTYPMAFCPAEMRWNG